LNRGVLGFTYSVMTSIAAQNKTSHKKPKATNALKQWQPLFEQDIQKVDAVLYECSASEATLIPDLVHHIIGAGGKRLRPVLTILSAKLFGYEGQRHIRLAAAIEFLHTATLLHDDVVDESD